MPQSGIYSVTVPGAVAGWDALRSRFGTKPFSEILAPAIYYAENGFPVTEVIGTDWAAYARMLVAACEQRKDFLVDGRAPKSTRSSETPILRKSLS